MPPDTSITFAPPLISSSTAAEFVFSSSEANSIFECDLDAGGWQACTSPKNLSSLADGEHVFKVRAIDQSGNADGVPAEYSWILDAAVPTITINDKPAGFASSTSALFAFSADEAAVFYCDIDQTGWLECASPVNYENLSEGAHNFKVKAGDSAGNQTASPAEYSWTISTSAAAVNIIYGPPDIASSTSAEFQLAANDANASYQCQLDLGGWQACTASTTVSDLSEGAHEFTARITDQAGNIGSSTQKTWLLDLTAPASTVASLPASYEATGFTVSWSGADADAAGATSTASGVNNYDLQYKIGAGEWSGWLAATSATSTVFNIAVDAGQAIYFRSRSRDLAGNLESWPVGADASAEISSKHLVISQLQVSGLSTEDEFIELYNPTDSNIDLSGYSIQYRGGGSQNFYASGKKNFLSDSAIKTGGYFLIAHADYAGNAAANLTYSGFIMAAAGGTIFLVNSHNLLTDNTATSSIVADRLAYGSGQYLFPEGTAYSLAPGYSQSLERKAFASSAAESMAAGGVHENSGNSYDSGDNSADFVLRASPKPRSTYIYDIVRDDLDFPGNFGRDYMFTDFKPGSSSLSGVAIKTTTSRAAGSFTVTVCKGVVTRDNYLAKANCGADMLIAQKTCDITNNRIWNAWQNCDFDNSLALVPNNDYYVMISGNTWVVTSYSDTNYGVNVVCGFNSGGKDAYCAESRFQPFLTLETYVR